MEKIEKRKENACLMERLDKILNEYGLRRRGKEQKNDWTVQKKISKNASEKELENVAAAEISNLFVDYKISAFVENKNRFENKLGTNTHVQEMSDEFIGKAFDILFQPNDRKFIFDNINGCTPYYFASKKDDGNNLELWKYLDRSRSKEDRMRMLFGGEKNKWLLAEEIGWLYKELRKEVESSDAFEKMKQEIFDLFKEEIRKANKR